MPNINLKEILDSFRGEHSQGIELLKEVIKMFDKGGISGTEKRAQAKYAQSAVGRGLAGSTVPAAISTGLSKEFEDIRVGRLTEAMNNLANFFASPGTIAHTATGGFGAQLSKEQQRFEQEQASFPSTISGNQQGLGYQPPSNFGNRSGTSPFSGPSGSSFRRGNVSSSADTGGGAWGDTALDISQQDRNKPRQTIAGMWTEGYDYDEPRHDAPYIAHNVPATGERTVF